MRVETTNIRHVVRVEAMIGQSARTDVSSDNLLDAGAHTPNARTGKGDAWNATNGETGKIMQHLPAYRSLCTQHEMKPAQLLFLPGYRALLSLVCLDSGPSKRLQLL
jgi:hypothetical protein